MFPIVLHCFVLFVNERGISIMAVGSCRMVVWGTFEILALTTTERVILASTEGKRRSRCRNVIGVIDISSVL